MIAKGKIPRPTRGILYELHSYFSQSYGKNSRARRGYIRPEYFNSRELKLSSISPFVNTLSNHTIVLMEQWFTVEHAWTFLNKETFSVTHIKIAHIKRAFFTRPRIFATHTYLQKQNRWIDTSRYQTYMRIISCQFHARK